MTKRPPAPTCPKCNSNDTIWNGGTRILCKSCGASSVTKKIKVRSVLDEDRPPCPRCGSRHVWKCGGIRRYCVFCGRWFQKELPEEF